MKKELFKGEIIGFEYVGKGKSLIAMYSQFGEFAITKINNYEVENNHNINYLKYRQEYKLPCLYYITPVGKVKIEKILPVEPRN